MHTDRDTTRIVRSWLEEGATALPDRVLDAVLDQVPATQQRRSWWPVRRLPDMNNALKIALAAAAVLVVAVIGFNLMPQSNQVAAPSQIPVPTPSQTPATSPSPSPTLGAAIGPLEPGTYLVDDSMPSSVPYTFTVPAGWSGRADGEISKVDADGLNFIPHVVTHVYADACDSEGTLTEVGPTVDDLVRALMDQSNSDASAPVDVTIGGFPAKRVDVSIPAGLDMTACRHGDALIQIWADPGETSYNAIPAQPRGHVSQVYIADVRGDRAVIVAGHSPTASASGISELQAVLDSIAFQP